MSASPLLARLLTTSSLPFYDGNSYALGVVMKTYLDELFTRDDPTSETTRAEMKAKGPEWCQYCDFAGSLDDAFRLWDAVSVLPRLGTFASQTKPI